MSNLTFSIKGSNENPTKLNVNARRFNLTVDEPVELGGTDHGANPVEFLLAGYAGCLNVVGHIVAKEQGIALSKFEIEIEGDINPQRFLGQSYDQRAGFQSLKVNIRVHSDADAPQLAKWLETVENRCPVNDNLLNPTPIKIKIEHH